MPKIPDEVVKRVIDRAKIEDVVGDFVTLRKAGVNLTDCALSTTTGQTEISS